MSQSRLDLAESPGQIESLDRHPEQAADLGRRKNAANTRLAVRRIDILNQNMQGNCT